MEIAVELFFEQKQLSRRDTADVFLDFWEESDLECFFVEEEPEIIEGFSYYSTVFSHGEKDRLLQLAQYFYKELSEPLYIFGQGEENSVVFIRLDKDSGEVEMRRWVDGSRQQLKEYRDWFNQGLPKELKV